MLCGFSSLWWPFGWNWSYLGFLGIIWRTCGSKCGGEGGGIFPTLCVECCLVVNIMAETISPTQHQSKVMWLTVLYQDWALPLGLLPDEKLGISGVTKWLCIFGHGSPLRSGERFHCITQIIWRLWCQKEVLQKAVGCNYLSLPEIPASGPKVLICHIVRTWNNKACIRNDKASLWLSSTWSPHMYIIAEPLHHTDHIDGIVQERCNSSALAMEICLSCTNPFMCHSEQTLDNKVSL